MTLYHSAFFTLAVALAFVGAPARPAWADAVAPDACDEPGEDCNNAYPEGKNAASGEEADEDGSCQRLTCNSGPIEYECLRCIADGGGCSCRVVHLSKSRSLASVLLLVGISALLWSRRRR